jgi:hypothetical protein
MFAVLLGDGKSAGPTHLQMPVAPPCQPIRSLGTGAEDAGVEFLAGYHVGRERGRKKIYYNQYMYADAHGSPCGTSLSATRTVAKGSTMLKRIILELRGSFLLY